MIGIYLNGGLGNMMFQIAALEDMGRRSGLQTCYPGLDERLAILIKTANHSQNAFEYLEIFKNFDWYKNYQDQPVFKHTFNIPHKYVRIEPMDESLYYGYFQSEMYFDRDTTLKLFEPAGHILEVVDKYDYTNSCSIHIRRGDYVGKYKGVYYVPDCDYYNAAIDKVKASHYFVFSDDPEWCYANFEGDDFTFVGEQDYVELFMMARCTHNIIANSSFSWWGSYLNQNPDKKIIAPSSWYLTYKYSSMDIYCNNWIII